MENKIINDYLISEKLDIDKIIDDFYGYIYVIVKNSVSISITNEDIEEIISDVFFAIWKNAGNLSKTMIIKPYLVGIAKNIVKNKYRKNEVNFPIRDYEKNLSSNVNNLDIIEEIEVEDIIQTELKNLKAEEYQAFMMFYYEGKKIKDIAKKLNCSIGKVKVILHRVRKRLKKNLEDGGYGYGE